MQVCLWVDITFGGNEFHREGAKEEKYRAGITYSEFIITKKWWNRIDESISLLHGNGNRNDFFAFRLPLPLVANEGENSISFFSAITLAIKWFHKFLYKMLVSQLWYLISFGVGCNLLINTCKLCPPVSNAMNSVSNQHIAQILKNNSKRFLLKSSRKYI